MIFSTYGFLLQIYFQENYFKKINSLVFEETKIDEGFSIALTPTHSIDHFLVALQF